LKPQLVGNTISGTNVIVSSPANYHYQVIDQSGRMLTKEALKKDIAALV
jgi:hypothetical protein